MRDVIRSCDNYERDFKAARENESSASIRTANASRFILEDDVAALRNLSGISENFWPKVNDALERSATVLGLLELIVDPEISLSLGSNITNASSSPRAQADTYVPLPFPVTSSVPIEISSHGDVATHGIPTSYVLVSNVSPALDVGSFHLTSSGQSSSPLPPNSPSLPVVGVPAPSGGVPPTTVTPPNNENPGLVLPPFPASQPDVDPRVPRSNGISLSTLPPLTGEVRVNGPLSVLNHNTTSSCSAPNLPYVFPSSVIPSVPVCVSIETSTTGTSLFGAFSTPAFSGASTSPPTPTPMVSSGPIITLPSNSSSPPISFHPVSIAAPPVVIPRISDSRSIASTRDGIAASQGQRQKHRLEVNALERERDELMLRLQFRRMEREKEVLRQQAEEKEFERQLEAKNISIKDSRELERARIEEEEGERLSVGSGSEGVNVDEWLNSEVFTTRPSTVSFSVPSSLPNLPHTPNISRGNIFTQTSGSDPTGAREASAGCPNFPQSNIILDPPAVSPSPRVEIFTSTTPPTLYTTAPLVSSITHFSSGNVNSRSVPATCATPLLYAPPIPVVTCSPPSCSSQRYPYISFGPMATQFVPCPSRPASVSMSTSIQPPIFMGQPLNDARTSQTSLTPPIVQSTAPISSPTITPSELGHGVVMERMLSVNLKNEARNLLTAARPSKDKLFSGDSNEVDFETFMARFERMTAIEGVDDRMKLVELPHYVTGTAAIIVSSYEDISDASLALTQIKTHLKRDFGRKVYSARQLLEQVLKGGALTKDKPGEIRTFLIKLEQAYRRGVETRREILFSNPELINEIIRRKLPFVSEKWASKLYDRDEKVIMDENLPELGFSEFLSFVRRLNGCKLHDRAIMTRPSSTHDNQSSSSLPPHRPPFRFPKVAPIAAAPVPIDDTMAAGGSTVDPVDISLAASTSSAPKTKKGSQRSPPPRAPGGTASSQGQSPCPLCSGRHGVYRCREFIKMDIPTRTRVVRDHRLCKKCLNPGHFGDQCPYDFSCRECEGPHNFLIHVDPSAQGNGPLLSQF